MEISASEIVERVTSRVKPGSIVLFHNAAVHTPEALPTILETLISQGYPLEPPFPSSFSPSPTPSTTQGGNLGDERFYH